MVGYGVRYMEECDNAAYIKLKKLKNRNHYKVNDKKKKQQIKKTFHISRSLKKKQCCAN